MASGMGEWGCPAWREGGRQEEGQEGHNGARWWQAGGRQAGVGRTRQCEKKLE